MKKVRLTFIDGSKKVLDLKVMEDMSLSEMSRKFNAKPIMKVDFIEDKNKEKEVNK